RMRAAVLYISHDLSLVHMVCDRVAVMYAGRVVEIGDSDEVFRNPQHPYTRALLAAIPTVEHRRGGLAAIEGSVPEFVDESACCRFSNRCPHATEICRSTDPPLRLTGESHGVACFAYESPGEWGRSAAEMPVLEERSLT
ncbi:MAG: oligopeptide/dipeptide ABC transporter ATP-binding protein, partial [Actinomycetota bacterium]